MPNNVEIFCSNCGETALHIAEIDGWRCDNCDQFNNDISKNPYPDND